MLDKIEGLFFIAGIVYYYLLKGLRAMAIVACSLIVLCIPSAIMCIFTHNYLVVGIIGGILGFAAMIGFITYASDYKLFNI